MKGENRGIWGVVLGLLAVVVLSACRATVAGDPDRPIKIEAHITIDVRQVKETAMSIEDQVAGKSSKPRSWLSTPLVSTAWAAAPELKYTTPEVQQALDNRKNRFDELKKTKAQGLIGEDNQGHVAALGAGAEVQSLVEAENRDREVIYRAIVEQNGLPSEAIATIRTTFGEVQRERAEAGEKIQMPSGEWASK